MLLLIVYKCWDVMEDVCMSDDLKDNEKERGLGAARKKNK